MPSGPGEQPHPEAILELAYGSAHCLLGDEQALGGPREAYLVGDRDEHPQGADIEVAVVDRCPSIHALRMLVAPQSVLDFAPLLSDAGDPVNNDH